MASGKSRKKQAAEKEKHLHRKLAKEQESEMAADQLEQPQVKYQPEQRAANLLKQMLRRFRKIILHSPIRLSHQYNKSDEHLH